MPRVGLAALVETVDWLPHPAAHCAATLAVHAMVCAPVTVAQSPNLRLDRFGRVRFHERPPAYEPASSSRTGTKPDRRPRRAPLLIHAGDGKRVFRADRAFAIAEQLAEKLQLFLRYTTLALRQRLLQRLNEGTQLGMALEGLTAADLAYQAQAATA